MRYYEREIPDTNMMPLHLRVESWSVWFERVDMHCDVTSRVEYSGTPRFINIESDGIALFNRIVALKTRINIVYSS